MCGSHQGPRISSFWLLILGGLAIVGSGCSSHLIASHEPMHSLGEPVILKAHARGLVDRIELRVKRFDVDPVTGEEVLETERELLVWVCNPFFLHRSLTCQHPIAFSGDGKIIEFHAKSISWTGKAKHERYRFASGTYPLETPIPVRGKANADGALDIVFVPESDMRMGDYDPTWSFFRMALDNMVDEIYFSYPAFRKNRFIFNFWYVDAAAKIDGPCNFTIPGRQDLQDSLASWADAITIVHSKPMQDCAVGNALSTEFLFDKSAIHESGHSLFGLRDEYPVANPDLGKYGPQPHLGNTFWDKEKCGDEAPQIGLPKRSCAMISERTEIWRIDPTGPKGCIMGTSQNYDGSDFGPACMRRINWRVKQCMAGDCLPLPAPDGPFTNKPRAH